MKNAFRMTMLAAVAAVVAAPAIAAPTINFSIQTTPLATPTFEYKYHGGKYVWEQKSAATQFTASADTNDNQLHWVGLLNIDSMGVGGAANFTGKVPSSVKSWSHSGPITFPASFLSSYQANFAEFCESNGAGQQVVKHGLSIIFSARQAYMPKPQGVNPVPQQIGSEKWASRTVNMPVKVVCAAKPAGGKPRPGGVAAEKGSFKVQSIALSFGGAPTTKPNPATVCKQAKLTVTVKANQAGAVKFRLWTKIGAAPTQTKVIDAWAKHDGKGLFVASYQENVSVNRTTGVQAKAEEMVNAIELSTPWKDVTLHCTDVDGGGLAGTPGNANPNGLPQALKQPKRVFDGPSGVTAGAKPTHAPVKPLTIPAQIKTAPVAEQQQRTTRHLGKALPRVQ
jgi:hypothetical protein